MFDTDMIAKYLENNKHQKESLWFNFIKYY